MTLIITYCTTQMSMHNCTCHHSAVQVFISNISSWDGRPFGRNRHRPKSRGLLCPFFGGQEKVGSRSNCKAQALTWNGPS